MLTSHPGHASQLVRESRNYQGLVAAGGDGTLHEVLQTMDLGRQRVALIPAGRGNSLARDLGLLRRPLDDLLHWQPLRPIDLMEVTLTPASGAPFRRIAASTVALGYAARVVRRARRLRRLGPASYAAAALGILPVRFPLTLEVDQQPARPLRLTGLIVNNTRHIANFHSAPAASCTDGLFEVMELDRRLPLQMLHNLSALSGRAFYEPYRLHHAQTLRVQLHSPAEAMIDGELLPSIVALEIRILPAALHLNSARVQ